MPLGLSSRALPGASDLADALRTAARELGHRPAVTVLRPHRREEQGYASLAQWAAKGAHLLELDYDLGPSDRVALVGPPGWMPVAVCLAAWWVGATVTNGDADLAVVHEDAIPPPGAEVLWFGDEVDGSPLAVPPHGEVWATTVQAFPDQPPLPRAAADLAALAVDGRVWTQAELLDAAAAWELDGPLGVELGAPIEQWIPAVAVRPLRTGRPSVVVAGLERDAAAPERVGRWVT